MVAKLTWLVCFIRLLFIVHGCQSKIIGACFIRLMDVNLTWLVCFIRLTLNVNGYKSNIIGACFIR